MLFSSDASPLKGLMDFKDGNFLGVSKNQKVYKISMDGLDHVEMPIYQDEEPNGVKVKEITILADGRVVGLDKNGKIYKRHSSEHKWVECKGGGKVTSISGKQMLLGIGADHEVYAKDKLDNPWVKLPFLGKVLDVSEKNRIYMCLGLNHYLRAWDGGRWNNISNAEDIVSIEVIT